MDATESDFNTAFPGCDYARRHDTAYMHSEGVAANRRGAAEHKTPLLRLKSNLFDRAQVTEEIIDEETWTVVRVCGEDPPTKCVKWIWDGEQHATDEAKIRFARYMCQAPILASMLELPIETVVSALKEESKMVLVGPDAKKALEDMEDAATEMAAWVVQKTLPETNVYF